MSTPSCSSVATIEPVSQAAVAFPASGTVATVDVAVGDDVSRRPGARVVGHGAAHASAQPEEGVARAGRARPESGVGRRVDRGRSDRRAGIGHVDVVADVVLARSARLRPRRAPTRSSLPCNRPCSMPRSQWTMPSPRPMQRWPPPGPCAPQTATDAGDGPIQPTRCRRPTPLACLAALDEVQIAQAATAAAQQQLAAAPTHSTSTSGPSPQKPATAGPAGVRPTRHPREVRPSADPRRADRTTPRRRRAPRSSWRTRRR